MKKLMAFPLLLIFSGLAFGQTFNVPPCNGTNGPACTDYFGVANYANSPLPVGGVKSIILLTGGSGYTTPVVTVSDFYNPANTTASAGAVTLGAGGAIASIAVASPGTGYIAPVVTITDIAGTGASAYAVLDPATTTGGIPKFVDALPDLKAGLASADTATFAGSDYYEIALVEYKANMHSSLPLTTLREYVQVPSGSGGGAATCSIAAGLAPSYLGPTILAQKNRPVRVKFTNCLPAGAGGNLFIPTDTTYMGAGMGPGGAAYTENRATLHLHGGNTPWISDGTPHQWTVPVGEASGLQKGDSVAYVPDMWFDASGTLIASCAGQPSCAVAGATNNPGQGALTFYWTNQQSGRLMFYHDHAYGITRLNVYVGEAAGYLIADPAEEDALAAATVPGTVGSTPATTDLAHLIPLVIQDKTFVPSSAQLLAEDPTWIYTHGGGTIAGTVNPGDLWFPHVYTTNQNPADLGGANAFGRWDYGPWFFPPQTSLTAAVGGALEVPCTSSAFPAQTLQPSATCPTCGCPIIPNPSGTPESFMDTPVVNGKAYPVLHVSPAAYRFRILSVANDRTMNLSLFVAADKTTATTAGAPGASAATLCKGGASANCTEVAMVPFSSAQNALLPFPSSWYTVVINGFTFDDRAGGVPDPASVGPPFIQIGTEGGLLPNVAVVQPQPINYVYNRRDITVGNVLQHALLLGPAERADVIVDFSAYNGQTLMLYNDAPAPVPAADPRIDYYTGAPDQVQTGGAPSTLPGYGPNTRTIMQIVVDGADGAGANTTPFALGTLQGALPGIFATSNSITPGPAIVPEPTYPAASGGNSTTATYGGISDDTMTYAPVGGTQQTITFEQKAIQELFTLDYGRMNATLGVEVPLTNFLTQTTIPYGYIDPPTEIIRDAGITGVQPQIWKITHNGVDTHFIHFHLFNVQVINRVGWDGAKRPPDANELGWKDTVRMNPLEDIFVALLPLRPSFPFPLPDSIRLMDTTAGMGGLAGFTGIDPNNLPITVINNPVNFGWEYVWHCHILGHEENDMMRPIIFQVAPPAPSSLTARTAVKPLKGVSLAWTDNSASETSFTIQRATDSLFTAGLTSFTVAASGPNTAYGGTLTYNDSTAKSNTSYFYRAQANDDFTPVNPLPAPWQAVPLASAWSNTASLVFAPILTVSPISLAFGDQFTGVASAPKTVTVNNTGTAALTISSIGIAPTGDFTQTNNCPINPSTLAAGNSCTVNVTFAPGTIGTKTASLSVSVATPATSQTVVLTGNGVAGPILTLSPTSVAFGNQNVNTTSAARTITVSNTGGGNTPLSINSISSSDPQFAVVTGGTCSTTFPITLTGGTNCTVNVAFTPTSVGAKTASLNINVAAPATSQAVALTGTGVGPVLTLSPTSLAFPRTRVGTISAAQTVTVSNTGNGTMGINNITLGGLNANQFIRPAGVAGGTCPTVATTLTAGASCTVNIQFAPTSTGSMTAALNVNVAAPAVSGAVALTGTGR